MVGTGIVEMLCGRKKQGLFIILAILYSDLAVFHFKFWFMRPRPDFTYKPSGSEQSPSFPSGHTMTASAGATAYSSDKNRSRSSIILVYGLSWLVAFSRMYLGLHYLSDVVSGMLISYIMVSLLALGTHHLGWWEDFNSSNLIYRLERIITRTIASHWKANLSWIKKRFRSVFYHDMKIKLKYMSPLIVLSGFCIALLFFMLFFVSEGMSSVLNAIFFVFDPEGERFLTSRHVQYELAEWGSITLLGCVLLYHALSILHEHLPITHQTSTEMLEN